MSMLYVEIVERDMQRKMTYKWMRLRYQSANVTANSNIINVTANSNISKSCVCSKIHIQIYIVLINHMQSIQNTTFCIIILITCYTYIHNVNMAFL